MPASREVGDDQLEEFEREFGGQVGLIVEGVDK